MAKSNIIPGTEVDKKSFWRGLRHRVLNSSRQEMVSGIPVAPPIGYKPQPSLSEQIREIIRSEKLAMEMQQAGVETFEEADDFDIPDDPIDPQSPYEADFEGDASRDLLEVYNARHTEEVPRQRHPARSAEENYQSETADGEQLFPEPAPMPPVGGAGPGAIVPGEAPPSAPRASAQPNKKPLLNPFRRG